MSADILQRIVAKKQERLNQAQSRVPLKELLRRVQDASQHRPWPLAPARFDVIAEVKRASPSLGPIPWACSLPELVQGYEQGGAGVISVLTEEDFFQGTIEDLVNVRNQTEVPVLRKDFIFTEYQVVESRVCGADVILLIVALLGEQELAALIKMATEMELEALVECHDREEVKIALAAGARTIGINNRNLRTFEVSLDTTVELMGMIPAGCLAVSESGIHTPEHAGYVADTGVSAVLVGESCVRSGNPAAHIAALLAEGRSRKSVR
ncbi:MAG: indole-3-glycerol phosphate synthase TrpC [Desulfitobacteriaceae bacterium]